MERTMVDERRIAEEFGISIKTLQNYRSSRKGLPYYKRPDGRVRYDMDECRLLLEAKKDIRFEPAADGKLAPVEVSVEVA